MKKLKRVNLAEEALNPQHILQELIRRSEGKKSMQRAKGKFSYKRYCFDKQKEFISDPSRFKALVTSRRAGKTTAAAAYCCDLSSNYPNKNCLYITLTRDSAAATAMWREICDINERYSLQAEINHTKRTLTFPNKSIIFMKGCSTEDEKQKIRGDGYHLVIVDESQAFKSFLHNVLEEEIIPGFADTQGTLCLLGTPNSVCAGPLFEASHKLNLYKGWSSHWWNIYDNPFIKKKTGVSPDDFLKSELKRKGITKDHPAFQRESLGKWVKTTEQLIYKFDPQINTYSELPEHDNWFYVMGVDLGFQDSDAIMILGFTEDSPNLYLIDEFRRNKLTITDLAETIKHYESKYRNFAKKVIDAGALGKKINEELRTRHGIHLEPAEKQRKFEFIELLNDDLRKGIIKVPPRARIIEEWELLQFDPDSDVPKEDSRYANHLSDAFLYAWRHAKHFTYAKKEKVELGTPEYFKQITDNIEQDLIKQVIRQKDPFQDMEESFSDDDQESFFR